MNPSHQDSLAKSVRHAVSASGYPFQARVMREAREACDDERQSGWLLDSAEFPVDVKGRNSRVDLLLFHPKLALYMCIECKRANPRFSRWVFLRLPSNRRREQHSEYFQVDFTRPGYLSSGSYGGPPDPGKYTGFQGPILDERCYHFGIGAKAKHGDGEGKIRTQEIEEATTQAVLGANGVLAHFATRCQPTELGTAPIGAVPVVVTTANLYSVEADIEQADIETGLVDIQEDDIRQQDYLYLQYPVSESLRPQGWSASINKLPWEIVDESFYRTVIICNAKSIRKLLRNMRHEWLTPWRVIETTNYWPRKFGE